MVSIAITGEGDSCIAAAHEIFSINPEFSVTLFEASASYGGRAKTFIWKNEQPYVFDLGVQAIQDPHSNPWTNIATNLNFDLVMPSINESTWWLKKDEVWHSINPFDTTRDNIHKKAKNFEQIYEKRQNKKSLSALPSNLYRSNNQIDLLASQYNERDFSARVFRFSKKCSSIATDDGTKHCFIYETLSQRNKTLSLKLRMD